MRPSTEERQTGNKDRLCQPAYQHEQTNMVSKNDFTFSIIRTHSNIKYSCITVYRTVYSIEFV